jgi:hypothetical protein
MEGKIFSAAENVKNDVFDILFVDITVNQTC